MGKCVIPERTTRSCIERHLWTKLCRSWEMLKVGAGSCLVSIDFDTLPSFLPFGTSHVGPPDYHYVHTNKWCRLLELSNKTRIWYMRSRQHLLQPVKRYRHTRRHLDIALLMPSLHCQSHKMHGVRCLEVHLSLLCSFPFESNSTDASHPLSNKNNRQQLISLIYIKNYWKITRMCCAWSSYPDKAIVEMHPQESSRDSFVICHGFLDCIGDDLVGFWTCMVVVVRTKRFSVEWNR